MYGKMPVIYQTEIYVDGLTYNLEKSMVIKWSKEKQQKWERGKQSSNPGGRNFFPYLMDIRKVLG